MATDKVTEVDAVVIGAGVAGLAATVGARARGLEVTLLEARERIGGRAYTDTASLGLPFDHGCHWLHAAARSPLRELADRYGLAYYRGPRRWRLHLGDRWATPAEVEALLEEHARVSDALDAIGEAGRDEPVAAHLPADTGFPAAVAHHLTAVMGAELEQLSTRDFHHYEDEGGDWPVEGGLGALVARFGRGVQAQLGAPVTRVDWSGPAVRVHSPRGVLRCRAVIITAPTSVLEAGALRFTPALPPWKQDAIAGLPMGQTEKIAMRFRRDVFGVPDHTVALLAAAAPQTPGFEVRPFGRPLAIAHVAGALAVELSRAGPLAMLSFARDQLAVMFGGAVRDALDAHQVTSWASDPWSLGAFSTALPGRAYARRAYARPIDDRLFFAGDAASIAAFGSAHGAYETGVTAAADLARALARGA